MKIVAVCQARVGSTRLPGKMLLPLLDKPLVQHVLERVKRANRIQTVVLAVPKEAESSRLEAAAVAAGCLYARFDHIPADDLVARYCGAALAYQADLVVRVPCDNPCVDPSYLDGAIDAYLADPFIYYSNTTASVLGVPVDGVGCEVVSRSRLEWLDQKTVGHPPWREHPHQFFVDYGIASLPPARLRLDVNTQTEYEKIRDLYQHFGHNHFTAADIVQWLLPQGDPYESCTGK